MDCIKAQAIISAHHDGEQIPDDELQAALAHCDSCEECAAFQAGLARLDAMPTPSAPAGLVDRVMGAVTAAAAMHAEEERAEARRMQAERERIDAVASVEPVPTPPSILQRLARIPEQVRWAGLGAVATIAATAIIALIVFGAGTTPPSTNRKTVSTASRTTGGADLTYGGAGSSAPPAATPAAPAQAPDLIAYKDAAYSPGALLADSAATTQTLGTVTTAFATGSTPGKATVYRSPLQDGSIVVKGPDGLRLYTPVTRRLAGVAYHLAAGNALDRFGVWPTLPAQFTTPTGSDGSPTFVAAGTDALGVRIYAASGQSAARGFAIAPGTSTTDPAGGNPNWTWWEPVD